MIMKKETLVFITSLAIIFIIGYVNLTMSPENTFSGEDYAKLQSEEGTDAVENDLAEIVEGDTADTAEAEASAEPEATANENVEEQPADVAEAEAEPEVTADENVEEQPTDAAEAEPAETDYEILGDITDITDLNTAEASSDGILNALNDSFASFKLNKEKGNMDVLDHLEENLSNAVISEETKNQFEALLLNKNSYIEAEQNIELMLQTKGYNETVVIVDEDMVKVVTNETIEQADATKILDVIVSETNYEPSQIKIVKFDNIDL